MFQRNGNKMTGIRSCDHSYNGLYTLGGVAALTAVFLVLLDIIISFGGSDVNPDTLTAVDWFGIFKGNQLVGFRLLGIINIISLTIGIPLYFSLYTIHRQVFKSFAALALILYIIGTAVYISNNAAIPMFVLSNKYAAATTDVQRTVLAAAGEAIVAKGADFTPGGFIGFFFTEVAGIAFSVIILWGRVFSKAAAYSGIAGLSLLSVFTVWVTFFPVYFDVAMILAIVGGILSMAWHIMVGLRLLKLGRLKASASRR